MELVDSLRSCSGVSGGLGRIKQLQLIVRRVTGGNLFRGGFPRVERQKKGVEPRNGCARSGNVDDLLGERFLVGVREQHEPRERLAQSLKLSRH